MDQPKRKHRATGNKPPGGRRDGAGRPSGSTNALDLGEVKALKAARLRVPSSATPEAAELADLSQQRIIDVMLCQVDPTQAGNVLKAATRLREEICGPLAQKVEHSGPDGGPLQVIIEKVGA